ncbi:Macrophage migration inhibitory factor [Lamellibrachia satsuma]|nr:Macrophage migration inhibitory factor [Lamellibrachia satsuma]
MFVLNTNVASSKIPQNFMSELSALVAKLLSKPETYVSIYINPGQMMMFGGSTDPCALCSLNSIGQLGQEENKRCTAALMEKINRDLKIPVNKMYINFTDVPRADCGWNGSTFA